MIVGIDVGGTNLKAGLVDDKKLLRHENAPLHDKEDLDSTLGQLKSLIKKVITPDIEGIGMGVPSIVDLKNGIIYDTVNIPAWKEVRMKEILEKEFSVPVFINNDCNCFALGEKYYGVGQPYQNLVGITLGTGIGSGVITENRLYCGSNCGAGEIGYLPYLDHDFEFYCGANFFETLHLTTAYKTSLDAEAGDPDALKRWATYGFHLGVALKSVLYAFDPDAIILGGAISKAYPFFQEQMFAAMKNTYFPNSVEKLKIHVSELAHVAILGAASLVHQYKKS